MRDDSKWAVSDLHEFSRIMKGLEKDVAELKESKAEHAKIIRELESSMLRGESSFCLMHIASSHHPWSYSVHEERRDYPVQ